MIEESAIDFKESFLVDLTYHMLCHCNINHISNIYSEEYISHFTGNLEDKGLLQIIQEAFNTAFDAMDAINFLPYYAKDLGDYFIKIDGNITAENSMVEEAKVAIKKYLTNQYSNYKSYWEHKKSNAQRIYAKFIAFIRNNSSLETILEFLGNAVAIYNSISLLQFGRGLGEKDGRVTIAVKFPEDESSFEKQLFTIMHELTHSITNPCIDEGDLAADPNLDEYMAVLFDYFILLEHDPDLVDTYIVTINEWFGTNCEKDTIEGAFRIDKKYLTWIKEKIAQRSI